MSVRVGNNLVLTSILVFTKTGIVKNMTANALIRFSVGKRVEYYIELFLKKLTRLRVLIIVRTNALQLAQIYRYNFSILLLNILQINKFYYWMLC